MSSEVRDVIIIGSGPAGYTAGIYLSRANLKPLLFAGERSGGQLMLTTEIENFPGFPEGVMGPKLMMSMREQAKKFGTEILDKNVTKVDFSKNPFKVWSNDEEYTAHSVIISTGAESIWLGCTGEQAFVGRGVSTCAVCDAAFFREKVTYVIGGGDAAMEDTLALTKFAKEVTVIHRRDSFKASKIMQDRVLNNPKVKVIWNSTVKEIKGTNKVEKIVVQTTDGSTKELPADGVFIAIGHKPSTEIFKDQITVDEKGYIVTGTGLSAKGVELANQNIVDGLVGFPTQTSVKGVFAAGDCVDFHYRQAITSAGMGCQAALDAEKWLESQA